MKNQNIGSIMKARKLESTKKTTVFIQPPSSLVFHAFLFSCYGVASRFIFLDFQRTKSKPFTSKAPFDSAPFENLRVCDRIYDRTGEIWKTPQ